MEEKTPHAGGRPSEYTQEKADLICERLAIGMSLRSVCLQEDMPAPATVFKWMRTNQEFLKQYEKAKQESSDAMAEDIQDIADESANDYIEITRDDGTTYTKLNQENIQRSRLRVDTRKWLMAKMKPKKYGDKLDLTNDGKAFPTPIYGGQSTNPEKEI